MGEYLFTKAITSPDHTVSFHLPEQGTWIDFWSNKRYEGGSYITQTYSLQKFPLFIKSGAIIPLRIKNGYTPLGDSSLGDSSLAGKQTVLIYPGGQSTYRFHRPKGAGTNYQDIIISYNEEKHQLKVEGNAVLPYVFLIKGVQKPKKIIGADNWSFDEAQIN